MITAPVSEYSPERTGAQDYDANTPLPNDLRNDSPPPTGVQDVHLSTNLTAAGNSRVGTLLDKLKFKDRDLK